MFDSKKAAKKLAVNAMAIVIIVLVMFSVVGNGLKGVAESSRPEGLVINDAGVVTGVVTPKYKHYRSSVEYLDYERHCFLGVTYAGRSILPVFENGALIACSAKNDMESNVELRAAPECLGGLTTMKVRISRDVIRFYVYNIETNLPYKCAVEKNLK